MKLGQDNIELWTKQLREPQYTKQSLTVFGNIEEPNIERIITTPKFGQSPPKGRDTTLKRLRESTEDSTISPKRFNINEEMMAEELTLSPGWIMPFQSTIISPPKEQQLNKIVQLVNNRIKPTSPTRRRTRSQDPKELPTNTEQKNNTAETQPNQGKTNQNTKKGEKIKEAANQQKQNHKENTRAARINRSLNKDKTPKQNPDNKTKENSKEQNKENKNKEEQDTTLNIVTSTPT